MLLRSLREKAAIATGNFARLFDEKEIPPFPQAAARLLELVGREEVDFGQVARIISSDAGLAARILRLVNSAHYGLPQRVADIRQAVSLLGLDRIQSLALGLSAIQALPSNQESFDAVAFWRDSLQRAIFSETLCRQTGWQGQSEAFTGALLQNLALPLLRTRWADQYLPFVEQSPQGDEDLVRIEDERLSWNHAQAGAWIARNWDLPDILVCCIGLHHSTAEELKALQLSATPVSAVAASAALPEAEGICAQMGIGADAYERICLRTDESSREMSRLFSVPQPMPLTRPQTGGR